jgi:uncharacterized membrane protein YhaH (DUF805 family)
VNFIQAIKSGFKNYVNFRGTVTRSEYWYWVLFTAIVSTILGMIDSTISIFLRHGMGYVSSQNQFTLLGNIWNLATLLPSLGLFVRRLRDAGYSLKRLWLYAIPLGLGLAALVAAVPAFISQAGRFEAGSVNWSPFVIAGLFLLSSGLAATVVVILFIVWLAQPSKPQPTALVPADSALPDFISPPGHPDTNTQY